MKKMVIAGFFLLAGCASFEAEMESVQKTVLLLREQYKEGIVVYKTEPGKNDIDSIIFNMGTSGQVDLTIKYSDFSFVYGLGLRSSGTSVSPETKEAKVMYRITDFKFLDNNEIRLHMPKNVAEDLTQQDRITLDLLLRPIGR